MKWYKRLSNWLLAIIVVALVTVIVFVVTAVIVPKVNKNYAADGFFTALFKDPPKNEHISTQQDTKTGAITLTVNAPCDYEYLEIKLVYVARNHTGKVYPTDIITYVDTNGDIKKEEKVFRFENIKKGYVTHPEVYQPSATTIQYFSQYKYIITVEKYK